MLVLNEQPAPGLADEESVLVSRAQARDTEAFSDLCRLHGGTLLRQATVLSWNAGMAEDLVQETLFEAWKSIHRYNGRCRFFTWLCSILLHRRRNLLRKRRPTPFSFLWRADRDRAEASLVNLADLNLGPDESAQHNERAEEVLRSLQRLPRKQREVIHLRFYAHESLEGIAVALGCSVGTVKSRLFHALERLRKMKSLDDANTIL